MSSWYLPYAPCCWRWGRRLGGVAVGAVLSVSAASGGLPGPVEETLARHRLPADSLSVWVQDVAEDAPLVSHRVDVPRNPASTIKLLTTLAALEDLGPRVPVEDGCPCDRCGSGGAPRRGSRAGGERRSVPRRRAALAIARGGAGARPRNGRGTARHRQHPFLGRRGAATRSVRRQAIPRLQRAPRRAPRQLQRARRGRRGAGRGRAGVDRAARRGPPGAKPAHALGGRLRAPRPPPRGVRGALGSVAARRSIARPHRGRTLPARLPACGVSALRAAPGPVCERGGAGAVDRDGGADRGGARGCPGSRRGDPLASPPLAAARPRRPRDQQVQQQRDVSQPAADLGRGAFRTPRNDGQGAPRGRRLARAARDRPPPPSPRERGGSLPRHPDHRPRPRAPAPRRGFEAVSGRSSRHRFRSPPSTGPCARASQATRRRPGPASRPAASTACGRWPATSEHGAGGRSRSRPCTNTPGSTALRPARPSRTRFSAGSSNGIDGAGDLDGTARGIRACGRQSERRATKKGVHAATRRTKARDSAARMRR